MAVRRATIGAVAIASAVTFLTVAPNATADSTGVQRDYTVVAEDGVSAAAAIAAIERAGGTVVGRTDRIGLYEVRAADGFGAKAAASRELAGAIGNRAVGQVPDAKPRLDPVEREALLAGAGAAQPASVGTSAVGMDPLDSLLWGLSMVRSDLARAVEPGDQRVTVGVLDSGIDATNPDLAANLDLSLSRNFAPDKPDVDGPCEVPSCLDPVGTDDSGHGTHVAGTIAAAANGFGISGVAPNVTLVQLKGGQDSGYVFLSPVVQSLLYAADVGIDVVNMSFYVDPWLYNCYNNPADSPEARAEQRAIILAMSRALIYAHVRGVTLVGSLGNNHEDLGNPRTDTSSPDYPPGIAYPRTIDNNTCFDLPVEGPFVLGVSALGPSTKKADYSNYGTEQISVAAPGGWFRDGFGTPSFRTNANMILSTYPKKVLQEEGAVDENGNIVPGAEGLVYKVCPGTGECAYYTYLQGTSMASPHASGVAALIVSRFGSLDGDGGLTLAPWRVESQLLGTAAEHACPVPPLQTYTQEGRSPEFNALCTGTTSFNGFYGHGIVDAHAAVTTSPSWGPRN